MRLDNGMISGRQYRRTLFLELFGSSVYAMTGLLVSKSRERCFDAFIRRYSGAGISNILLENGGVNKRVK